MIAWRSESGIKINWAMIVAMLAGAAYWTLIIWGSLEGWRHVGR